jgi:hypothetical protein
MPDAAYERKVQQLLDKAVAEGLIEKRMGEDGEPRYVRPIEVAVGDDSCAGIDTAGGASGSPRSRRPSDGPESRPENPNDREALLWILAHAARALAAAQISIISGFERVVICASCGRETLPGVSMRHSPRCLAAEVTALVDRLAQFTEPNLEGREDATERRNAGASDGNPSRLREFLRDSEVCRDRILGDRDRGEDHANRI